MIYLQVSYDDKDTAKRHGARWDAEARKWYYPGGDLPPELAGYCADPTPEADLLNAAREIVTARLESVPTLVAAAREILREQLPAPAEIDGLTPDEAREVFAELLAVPSADIYTEVAQHVAAQTRNGMPPAGDITGLIDWALTGRNRTAAEILEIAKKINMGDIVARVMRARLMAACKRTWDQLSTQHMADHVAWLGDIDISTLIMDYRTYTATTSDGRVLQFTRYFHDYWGVDGAPMEDRVERMGKFVGWAHQTDQYRAFNRSIRARATAVYDAKIQSVQIADRSVEVDAAGNWTANTLDGRIISGFAADGEWYLTHIGTHNIDANIPEAERVANQVRDIVAAK